MKYIVSHSIEFPSSINNFYLDLISALNFKKYDAIDWTLNLVNEVNKVL